VPRHIQADGLTPTVAGDAGSVKLLVKPSRATRKRLRAAGRARVLVKVTFTPTGGSPNTQAKRITLIERRRGTR
jgi:hypothetical protein